MAHSDGEHGLELDVLPLLRHGVRLLGLAERPREAVEHVTTVASRLDEPWQHHLEDELVRYEITPPQVVSGNLADPRPVDDLRT